MENSVNSFLLAVEDSMVQAKRLEYFFKKNNFDYHILPTGEEALEFIKVRKPTLVISDVIMPGMDGYMFCKAIKSNSKTFDIPVILLTSLQDPNDIIRGLQAGADNFITKPYEESFLLSRIEYFLNNRENTEINQLVKEPIDLKYRGENFSIASDRKQILNLLLSVYDTAIQRNEELIQIKTQLEESNNNLLQANEDLEAFSRTVSHDLKSPLSVIIGFASAIMDNGNSSLNKEELSYIKYIYDSAHEMNQLIKDLLAFSQSGKATLKKEKISLSGIANDLIDNIKIRYNSKNTKVTIEENMIANGDDSLLRIVLDNLLGNALKYSSKSENPSVVFGKKEYLGKDLFFVSDNGIGFDMAKAENLFQPFVRLHTGGDYSGTGVGLSTVKRVIEKHDGDIWAESEPGKGATIYFTLE